MLIVDDLEAKRLWMRSLLETRGHVVHEAADGRDALAKIAGTSVDLVVTDINMPGMDGVELIHELRAHGAATLKILAVSAGTTGFSSDASLQAGSAVGADGVLYMPCSPTEFLEAINTTLAR